MDDITSYLNNFAQQTAEEQSAKLNARLDLVNGARTRIGDFGLSYDPSSADSYLNYLNDVASWKREDDIRKEGYAREDSSYQRLVKDLAAAGLNPALVLSNASAQTGSANAYSASTVKSNDHSNERTSAANSAKGFAAIVAALGLLAAAALKH